MEPSPPVAGPVAANGLPMAGWAALACLPRARLLVTPCTRCEHACPPCRGYACRLATLRMLGGNEGRQQARCRHAPQRVPPTPGPRTAALPSTKCNRSGLALYSMPTATQFRRTPCHWASKMPWACTADTRGVAGTSAHSKQAPKAGAVCSIMQRVAVQQRAPTLLRLVAMQHTLGRISWERLATVAVHVSVV